MVVVDHMEVLVALVVVLNVVVDDEVVDMMNDALVVDHMEVAELVVVPNVMAVEAL